MPNPLPHITPYLHLMRMHRPIGALLLLWPTLCALWLASDGHPPPTIVLIFILGVFTMRAAGCVINDYADRHIDPHVKRTRDRPLASGRLRPPQALALLALLLILALALVLQLNPHAQLLSLPALAIAALYPFTKRFLRAPQLVLGIAFSMGIPMAYAALNAPMYPHAYLLFAANFAWVVAYDTQYALVDRDDDLKIGIKSSAILFGARALPIIALWQITSLALFALLGWHYGLSKHFAIGLACALALAIYQQFLCRTKRKNNGKPSTREGCLRAFHNNNWLGATLFCGIALSLLH